MANRPVLLNNNPVRSYRPLIELVGPVDCGKIALGRLLARRLHGRFLSFPSLNPLTPAGRALFELVNQSPGRIMEDPAWWAHLYAAMLMEQRPKLLEALEAGPVVVANYLTAFRIWSKSSGVQASLNDWTPGLPEPSDLINLTGAPYPWPGNVPARYPEELLAEVARRMGSIPRRRAPRIRIDGPERFPYLSLNRAADEAGALLHSRYGIPIDYAFVYTKENYPLPRKIR